MRCFSPHHVRLRWAVWAIIFVVAFFLPAQRAQAQSPKTPWQKLTTSQLTAVWWQSLLGLQVSKSPWFDTTGANAFNGQPYYTGKGNGDLLFLAGTITSVTDVDGNVFAQVTRSISVKQGTAFFFPLINTEWDHVGITPRLAGQAPPGKNALTEPELRALAAAFINSVTGAYSTLTPYNATFTMATGPVVDLLPQNTARLQSPVFSYTLPATDNIYQINGVNVTGTVAPTVSDGYWTLIPGTLAPGNYLLQFGGVATLDAMGHTFNEMITYKITVTP